GPAALRIPSSAQLKTMLWVPPPSSGAALPLNAIEKLPVDVAESGIETVIGAPPSTETERLLAGHGVGNGPVSVMVPEKVTDVPKVWGDATSGVIGPKETSSIPSVKRACACDSLPVAVSRNVMPAWL